MRLHIRQPRNFIGCLKRQFRKVGDFLLLSPAAILLAPSIHYWPVTHKELPWDRIHIFFGDERHVPPDHPDSNFRMASESLLSKVPIPENNVHRIRAELEADAAAKEYEQELRDFFHLTDHDWPRFDLIFLGIGEDGHTASLFPGSKALAEASRRVAANWVEKFQAFRITLTFPVLNHAAEVLFMVSGAGKAQILSEVLRPGNRKYPAQNVQPQNGQLLWLVDQDAGSLLRLATPPAS